MEEQIFEIIESNGNLKTRAAREITTHVMEFIEWLSNNEDFWKYRNVWFSNIEGFVLNETTTEQIYQYWLSNEILESHKNNETMKIDLQRDAAKFLLDNNCGDLVLNEHHHKNDKIDRIYASDLMASFIAQNKDLKEGGN